MKEIPVIIAGVVVITVLVGFTLLLLLRARPRKLRTVVDSIPLTYRLLVVFTESKADKTVRIKGYGLFTYTKIELRENLIPVLNMTQSSINSTETGPVMEIVRASLSSRTYQFYDATHCPEIPADRVPICLNHNIVLFYLPGGKIAPCPETLSPRVRATGKLQKKSATTPLVSGAFADLRSAIATSKWYILM